MWTAIIDHRSGTCKGAKLLNSTVTQVVILTAAPLIELAFLNVYFKSILFVLIIHEVKFI